MAMAEVAEHTFAHGLRVTGLFSSVLRLPLVRIVATRAAPVRSVTVRATAMGPVATTGRFTGSTTHDGMLFVYGLTKQKSLK